MASKNVVADLNKGEKLNGSNYDMWHRKIQYLFNEQEVLDTLTTFVLKKGPQPNITVTWKTMRNGSGEIGACYTILSNMRNDLIEEFEVSPTAHDMWNQLKITYVTTSATRLRALILKFEQYAMDPKHLMVKHLKAMFVMILDLKVAGNILTDEQHGTAVIHSLLDSWRQMKLVLTHNKNIKNFVDISRHLDLKAECLGSHHNTVLVA